MKEKKDEFYIEKVAVELKKVEKIQQLARKPQPKKLLEENNHPTHLKSFNDKISSLIPDERDDVLLKKYFPTAQSFPSLHPPGPTRFW